MKTKRIAIPMTAVALGLCYFTINTRMGAYVVLDLLQESEESSSLYDASEGPLTVTATLSPREMVELPAQLEQPSGIQHRGDTVYISTDQGELFVLDHQFALTSDVINLLGGPLLFRQGLLEAIELVNGQLLAVGEFGAIRAWETSGGEFKKIEDVALPPTIAGLELSGITQMEDKLLASSDDHPGIIDLTSGEIHELSVGEHLKQGADLSSLEFSGLASANGLLYVLSETHSSILVVEPDGFRVVSVYGIHDGPVADIAVRDGLAYVVVDHEYVDPRPPLFVYELP